MKKLVTTAILGLMISSVFAGNGWDKHGNGYGHDRDRDNHQNTNVVIYRAPAPQRNIYVQQQPVRYVPVQQCGPVPMDPGAFCQLQETMNHSGFESSKMNIFRQAMAYNYFTSQQVLQIMNQFSFESYRLDVAKMTYSKTVDPGNYYVVNNAFSFSSSVNELGDYLAMR